MQIKKIKILLNWMFIRAIAEYFSLFCRFVYKLWRIFYVAFVMIFGFVGDPGLSVWTVRTSEGVRHVDWSVAEEVKVHRDQHSHRLWTAWLLWTSPDCLWTGIGYEFTRCLKNCCFENYYNLHAWNWVHDSYHGTCIFKAFLEI